MDPSKRRTIQYGLAGLAAVVVPGVFFAKVSAEADDVPPPFNDPLRETFRAMSEQEWKARLTPEQFHVLRKEGTERPGTSPLNDEKRTGVFHCAGCDNPLFDSSTKYESGTGWPSFYDHLPGAIETKKDFKLIVPRTEYHCARCGGHHGHVFTDGPKPTGLRYCNNGVALKFVPA